MATEWTEGPNDVVHVMIGMDDFTFCLRDGRKVTAPMWWYPRLYNATPEQRRQWEIMPIMDGVHWEDIDEDISVAGLLIGGAAPGAVPPVMDAAE